MHAVGRVPGLHVELPRRLARPARARSPGRGRRPRRRSAARPCGTAPPPRAWRTARRSARRSAASPGRARRSRPETGSRTWASRCGTLAPRNGPSDGAVLTGASHRKTMFRDMEQSSPYRHPGGGSRGAAADPGRAAPGPGHLHRADVGERAGQEHHVAAADRAGAQRPGPPRSGAAASRPARSSCPTPAAAASRPTWSAWRSRCWTRLGDADRRDHQPRRAARRRPGRADRSGRQQVPDRRDELGRADRPAALRRPRQGAARLRGSATCRAAGWSGRTARTITSRGALAGRAGGRARPRLRSDRRGAGAGPGRRRRAGIRRRGPWSRRCRSPPRRAGLPADPDPRRRGLLRGGRSAHCPPCSDTREKVPT